MSDAHLMFRSPDGRCTKVSSDDTVNIRKLAFLGWVCPEWNQAAPPPVEALASMASASTSAVHSDPPAPMLATTDAAPPAPGNDGEALVVAPAAGPEPGPPAGGSGVALVSTGPELIDRALDELAKIPDVRVRNAVKDLKRLITTHRSGGYVPPRFRIDELKPF
jgi:hypothetical protein